MNKQSEAQLVENYQNNLQLFKKVLPDIYNRLITEKNEKYSLEINQTGLNLSIDGKLLYPDMDMDNYYNTYIKKEDSINKLPFKMDVISKDWSLKIFDIPTIHNKYRVDVAQKYKTIFGTDPSSDDNQTKHSFYYSMTIFGIGLGYHIPKILQKNKVKHLILIDTDIEMLRASLFTLDWLEIFKYFQDKNDPRYIKIIIEDSPEKIEGKFSSFVNNTLPFFNYNMYEFMAYNDKNLQAARELIYKNIGFYTGTFRGFFDDEKWSLQHTIHNIKEQTPILSQCDTKVDNDKHLFIVGNGPSVDDYIDVIQKNKDRVIIIACGSSLSTLKEYGIKPHIFIATERRISTYYDTIKAGKEFLKDITFIGMNTIHPRVLTLFEKKYIFLKGADSGSALLSAFDDLVYLDYSNPTVTNGALSLGIYLGFRNISLFGMDFGFKSEDKHHSKNSLYYDDNYYRYKSKDVGDILVEGVDGETIISNYKLNSSKKQIENLIEREGISDLKVYNFSNGAKINFTLNGSEYKSLFDNLPEELVNTDSRTMEQVCKQFTLYKTETDLKKSQVVAKIKSLKSFIKENKKSDMNIYEFLSFCDNLNKTFYNNVQEIHYLVSLMYGTIPDLMARIYVYASSQKQSKKLANFFENSIDILYNCIEDMEIKFKLLDKVIDCPY